MCETLIDHNLLKTMIIIKNDSESLLPSPLFDIYDYNTVRRSDSKSN